MNKMAARPQPRFEDRAERTNDYFLDGDGISREVITADICRYLGNDALVRPTTHQGRHGYIITAYRNLTSNMITDLKADSARWEQDVSRRQAQGYSRGTYSSSSIPDGRPQQVGPSPVYSSAPPPVSHDAHAQPPQAPYGSMPSGQGYPMQYQQNPNYQQNTSPYPQAQSPYGSSNQNQPSIPAPDMYPSYTHQGGSGYPPYPEGRVPRYSGQGDEYDEYIPVSSGMSYATTTGMSHPTTAAPDMRMGYQPDVYQDPRAQPRDPHRRGR